MKYSLLLFVFMSAGFFSFGQIDTVQYAAQRQEIRELLYHSGPGKEKSCGDLILVGPKGDISFSRQEWIAAQQKLKLTFRGIHIVPGTEVIRIYDGGTAVVNWIADVAIVVDGKNVSLKVRRLEVYHKNDAGWCMVAGQGTEVDEQLFPVAK